jgi:hypothetical protein
LHLYKAIWAWSFFSGYITIAKAVMKSLQLNLTACMQNLK